MSELPGARRISRPQIGRRASRSPPGGRLVARNSRFGGGARPGQFRRRPRGSPGNLPGDRRAPAAHVRPAGVANFRLYRPRPTITRLQFAFLIMDVSGRRRETSPLMRGDVRQLGRFPYVSGHLESATGVTAGSLRARFFARIDLVFSPGERFFAGFG